MRFFRPLRNTVAAAAALALIACAQPGGPSASADEPRTVAKRSQSDQKIGDENHPKILAQFGGEVKDRELRKYVNEIGRRIAAKSEQPNAKWTFTVLDSPVVNAFALPGGYVYVTRGLLGLANNEAELAGVIGHEIGHVTAEHGSRRQSRATTAQIGILAATIGAAILGLPSEGVRTIGQIGSTLGQGYVASYSREQEFESDRLGVRYLARAGYDPKSQAKFLASLQRDATLQSKVAGGEYNPNRVDFFSSHPATAERVRKAIRAAGVENVKEAPRNRARFFKSIDGMIYGHSPDQGFVDGRTFSHPVLKFKFTVPEGFRIQNSAAQVSAAGPKGSGIIFDGDKYRSGTMDAYITRTWVPAIAKQTRVGKLRDLRRRTIDGHAAASATLPVQTQKGVRILRMTAIRKGKTVYRFLGVQPEGANAIGERMDQAPRSFRKLTNAQARRLKPKRIAIRKVRKGDTVASLARLMTAPDRKIERFRVLNGLESDQKLGGRGRVKLIVQ